MKNNYPTFPNPAGIGSGMGYQTPGAMGPQAAPAQADHIIPSTPHAPMVFKPTEDEPDPLKAYPNPYNPQGRGAFNPWGTDAG